MLRRLVILFVVLLSAVTISTVAIGVADKVVPTCEDGHTWDLALVTEQATCTEEGKLTKTCKVCGETEDIVMDALGHDLVAVAGSAKEPSCEEDGYTGDKECLRSGCSYIEEGEVIPAAGHDYDKVVTAPTCEEDGYTTYTCDCGKSYIADEVDALGHAYGEWTSNGDGTHKRVCANDTAHVESGNCAGGTATCQELAECSVCGGDYGELLAHIYNQEVATDDYLEYAANCQSPATYFKSCACGEKGTETFTVGNPGNHNYDREVVHEDYIASVATCTEPAKYFKSCVCGLKGTETFSNGEALGHRDTEVNITAKAPTCTEAGCTEGVFCNDCNTQIKESEPILALGHSPATAVKENEVAATCTNAGSYDSVVYCSVSDCGVELSRETKTVDALGHKGSTEIANKCANCDHVFSVSEIIEMANALESNETLVGIYELTAVVKEITYASATPSIDVTLTDGTVLPCFKAKGTVASSLVVGDTVTLKGTINNYNGTVQFNQPEVVASKHTVTVEQTENGTTSVNVDGQVARGETVIITATPDTNYEIDNVIVNENPIQAVEGVYSFVVEKATIVKVTYKVAGSQGEVIASTLILKHNSSTTTNMNGGENEANDFFGLDENEWSVIASKGSASNNVGLNVAGDFRLYFNTNGSNTLTVSSTKYTIQTISMTFTDNSYSNVSVKVNGQLVTPVDGVYTINANEFVLGNANTSNVQVRIKNVEIKYVASSSAPTCEHTNTTTTQENRVDATCTADGSYEEVVTCEACGEELSRETITVNALGHTPAEDDGDCTTDIACSTCGQVAVEGAENHTPNADDGDCTTAVTCSNCSIVTTEAKASHTGGTATCKELAKCTECGTAYGSYASHNVTFTEGKDATCTEDGNQAYWACSVCSKNFKEEECLNVWDSVVIDALNHIDEDNNKICDRESCKQALCDEDSHILVAKNDENYHWQECSACKNVFDKQEHTYTETVVEPTCTTDGYTLHECDCEYSYQSDEVSARHTPAEDDGDCTTAITCSACGTITTEAKASHIGGTATCVKKAECSVCGKEYGELADHDYTNGELTNVDGEKHTVKCVNCTNTKEEAHTPVDGECACGYVEPVVVNAPYYYEFTSNVYSANGTQTLNGINWTVAGEGDYFGYNATKGQQLGSGSAPYKTMTLTSSEVVAKIGKIIINTSGASSIEATLVVKVNGVQIGEAFSLTATATDYTFEAGANDRGIVEFVYTQESSKAIYIKSIKIVVACDNHIESETKGYDENQHWDICSVCGEQIANSAENHTTTTTTKDATCTATGSTTTSCECGYSVTTEIPMADHTYVDGACSVCGATESATAEPVTASMSSFSTTSGNVGGDSNVTYETAKGGGTSNPAVNSNQIRLYQNSAGTGGGTITIIAKEGYKIQSVTIGSGMGTSIAYTIDTATAKSTTVSLAKDTTYEVEGLNASSITFYCMGTTSSTRLYVNYLSVTYVKA